MAKRKPDPDAYDDAARVLREATGGGQPNPDALEAAALEAAWADWSKRIHGLNDRTLTLLRAAFEAGWDAGQR